MYISGFENVHCWKSITLVRNEEVRSLAHLTGFPDI
jgi:hypothetical protein